MGLTSPPGDGYVFFVACAIRGTGTGHSEEDDMLVVNAGETLVQAKVRETKAVLQAEVSKLIDAGDFSAALAMVQEQEWRADRS